VFRDLRITNFRGFRNFQMDGLGRINLLVGPNNCGKSTVLEALLLLAEQADPAAVGLTCFARGGMESGDSSNGQKNARIAVRHIFYGHQAILDSEFSILSNNIDEAHILRVGISRASKTSEPNTSSSIPGRLTLNYSKTVGDTVSQYNILLTSHAEWPIADLRERAERLKDDTKVQFIGPEPSNAIIIAHNLSLISLNPEEKFVLDVLRILEPRIVGITATSVSNAGDRSDRNGVYVKLSGETERIPIASLGDGVWRLLGLALALVHARGSVLLVDEIDIGLHYTAQVDMWRMVKGAAETLDVQVFATTHSSDCIRALASLARPDVTTGSEITIQRIEGERAVAYNEREIVLAAERGIEVR
jgi:predicted ATPase